MGLYAPIAINSFNRPKAISGLATAKLVAEFEALSAVSIARRRLVVLRPTPSPTPGVGTPSFNRPKAISGLATYPLIAKEGGRELFQSPEGD